MIAVANADPQAPHIHIYDINYSVRQASDDPDPTKNLGEGHIVLTKLHKQPVSHMKYNEVYNTVISIDTKGIVEYWDAEKNSEHDFPKACISCKNI